MDQASHEKYWLIRSSTRITGPFTYSEVADLLRTKQISIIDEIRRPEGRWTYVRENKIFLDLVKTLRHEQDHALESTMTQSVAAHSMTRTEPITLNDDFTPTPQMPQREPIVPPAQNVKDIVPTSEVEMPRPHLKPVGAKSYGAVNDPRIQKSLARENSLLRWTILGLACVFLAVASWVYLKRGSQQQVSYEDLINEALRLKSIGLYEQSLQFYRQAQQLQEPDSETQYKMAAVIISEGRQAIQGRRILERAILQDGRTRQEVIEGHLSIAVSYMLDGDLREAEQSLQKVLGFDPNNLDAKVNYAMIGLKKGDYVAALKYLKQVLELDPRNPLLVFGKSLAQLEVAKSVEHRAELEEMVLNLPNFISQTYYLKQELTLFYLTALIRLGGKEETIKQVVHTWINELPADTLNFSRSLLVDWRMTQWDYMDKICSEAVERMTLELERQMLKAICLQKSQRSTEARSTVEQGLVQFSTQPPLMLLQAWIMWSNGQLNEAMAALNQPALSGLTGKYFLQGKICQQQKRVDCVGQNFGYLLKIAPDSPFFNFGMAWYLVERDDRQRAFDVIATGLRFSPPYVPLLELRDQLEAR